MLTYVTSTGASEKMSVNSVLSKWKKVYGEEEF